MMCDDAQLLLHAYLDDELDAAHSAAVARHMQECAGCAARYDTYAMLRKAIAQPSLYQRAPDALRQRWHATLAPDATPSTPPRARRVPWGLAMAASVIAAVLIGSPLWWNAWRPADGGDALVAQVVSGHVRSLQVQHLMDVVSTDQHTVKPWFEGKLDFAPRVHDLANEGFPLVGGRLDALDGHTVAALIYKRRLHVINLYQWPATHSDAAQSQVQRQGFTVIRWTADGMSYAAISDVAANDLRQFVLAFQNDGNAPPPR
ncbi:anti-sigma factor [Dyella sp. ASV21]|uniref:anti-sigma factor family protein n=1 Tax=Dyella sp. ASV21 TaxID=2795114 RepID=UPI0018ECC5FD|nr:anti-sigma factor [Dyella sp. ASV21]